MPDKPRSAAEFRKQLQAKQAAAAAAMEKAELAKEAATSAKVADVKPKTMPGAEVHKGSKKEKKKGGKQKPPKVKRKPPEPKFRLPAGADMHFWQPVVGMWYGTLKIPGCDIYMCNTPRPGDYGQNWVAKQLGHMWWKEHGEKMVVKLDMPCNDPTAAEVVSPAADGQTSGQTGQTASPVAPQPSAVACQDDRPPSPR
jgi:hypothetical protein